MGTYMRFVILFMLAALTGCEPAFTPGGDTFVTNEGDTTINNFYGDDDDSASVEEAENCRAEVTFSTAWKQAEPISLPAGSEGARFGSYVLRVFCDGPTMVSVKDFAVQMLVNDEFPTNPLESDMFQPGSDNGVLASEHVNNVRLVNPVSATTLMGPTGLDEAGIARFTDDVSVAVDENGNGVTVFQVTADLTEVQPQGVYDAFAVRYLADTVVTMEVGGEEVEVPVTLVSTNNGVPSNPVLQIRKTRTASEASYTVSTAIAQPDTVITSAWTVVGNAVTILPSEDLFRDELTFVVSGSQPMDANTFNYLELLTENVAYTGPSVNFAGGVMTITFEGEFVFPAGIATNLFLFTGVGVNTSLMGGATFTAEFPVGASLLEDQNGDVISQGQVTVLDDTFGGTFTYLEAPTVSENAGTPGGEQVPGFGEILRFNAFGGNQDTLLSAVGLELAWMVAPGSTWNTCQQLADWSKWQVYDAADLSTPLSVSWSFAVPGFGPCSNNPNAPIGAVGMSLNQVIPASTVKTYVVFADFTGASAVNDDQVLPYVGAVNGMPLTLPVYGEWLYY